MKILFIPYGTEKAPATRYRVSQFLPYLKKRNIDCTVFSAISEFSTTLMIKSPDFKPVIKFLYYIYIFIERLVRFCYILAISKKYDIIFLQRTTIPFKLERLLTKLNANIIFDIDDAIYLPDKEGKDPITRIKKYIKKNEVINILKVAKMVVVENAHIENFVSKYCKNILKIPGPIDIERFSKGYRKEDQKEVTIGWIGSPATTRYLHMLDDVFKAIREKYDFVRFKFIGLGNYKNDDIEFEKIEWIYATEVRDLQSFDIGIMPMPDNEWTRGKLGCKMLQYMAVGVPAVVSFTPTNAEIINDKLNGFFATNKKEWIDILSDLIEDRNLRERCGENGRETILEKCSLSVNAEKLANLLFSLPK